MSTAATTDAARGSGQPLLRPGEQPAPPRSAALADGRASKVTLARVVRSEWTKLRSLRSTWVTLALAALISIGFAALIGASISSAASSGGQNGGPPPEVLADASSAVLGGTGIASLVFGVLGALVASGEYATGMIRASLTAVPHRWPVLVAKALVLTAVVAVLGAVLTVASYWLGTSLLPSDLALPWGHAGVVPALVGNTGYLVAVTLLGLGLGFLLRSTASSITVLVAVIFVLPPLLGLIPWEWVKSAVKYFPGQAQSALTAIAVPGPVSDTAAVLTLVAWALVPLLVGAVLLQRRDA